MNKIQMVELEANGVRQSLEINHAERLLRMPNNGGWVLPENSRYTFDFNNGIEFKRNTREIKQAGTERADSESNQAAEQD